MGEFFAGRKNMDSDGISSHYALDGWRFTQHVPALNTLKNYFRRATFAIGRSYQEVVKPYVAAFPHMFLLCSDQGVSLYVPTPMGLLKEAENFRRAHGATATEAVEGLLRGDFEHVLVRGGQLNHDVLKFEALRYDELYVKEQFFTSEMSDEEGWTDDDDDECHDCDGQCSKSNDDDWSDDDDRCQSPGLTEISDSFSESCNVTEIAH